MTFVIKRCPCENCMSARFQKTLLESCIQERNKERKDNMNEKLEANKPTNDPVNHPKHYTSHPSGVECITVTEHLNFNVGNAIKYLWRAGVKDQDTNIEDLQKSIWYIKREILRLEGIKSI